MQFLYLALFRGRCLASLFAIALIATTTSIAMPFPASSLVPTLYKRSTSNNVLNPLVRSLQWNANHSADPARVIHTPPLKRVLIGGNDSNMELLSLGSQHLNSLNECTTKYQDTEIFRDRCTSSAASIEAILQVLANTLRPMAARYGLKNYNKDDPMETFLKRTIDLVKDLLAYIAKLVKRSPLMGVALYPVVYQVKCIIIEILDILENCTDDLINELRALLAACSCGSELAGLCPGLIGSIV